MEQSVAHPMSQYVSKMVVHRRDGIVVIVECSAPQAECIEAVLKQDAPWAGE